MGKIFYRAARQIIRIFSRPMTTEWESSYSGDPCIFVANHMGAAGPIAMCAHFPLRDTCRPWINSPVMDSKQMPDYVRTDLWWDHDSIFHPFLNVTVPWLAAALIPPLMRGAGGIPVYRDMGVMTTFRKSIEAMKKGDNLLIFPEKISEYGEYSGEMNTGWLFVADMWYKATGRALEIYPVFVDKENHRLHVSRPILWDTTRSLKEQTDDVIRQVAEGIRGVSRSDPAWTEEGGHYETQ